MSALANLVRGLLIGTAEVIPGVSGGTIALIVGIYQRVIDSAAAATAAIALAIRFKFPEALAALRKVDYALIIPMLIGMFSAIFLAAAAIEPLLESHPEIMRGLFFGMILVSLAVPFRMANSRWQARDFAIALVAAAVSFALLSLPRAASGDVEYYLVFFVAALAVCALVLPGVSGSFLLLALGFYAPTIAAVNDRDFVYLGIFVLGAVAGLMVFSTFLSWLLSNYRRVTLVVMAGLMLGSLRAIWPWQEDSGELLAPRDLTPGVAIVSGALVVMAIMIVESRIKKAQ